MESLSLSIAPLSELEKDFIQTSIQTLVFPSEESKKAKRAETKDIKEDELNYEVFTTRDSLRIGVKLLVTYKIKEPEITLKTLGRSADINRHIENITAADMAKVIQKCDQSNFLSYDFTTAKKAQEHEMKNMDPYNQQGPKTLGFLDEVKKEIREDLEKCGIELNA